jgi:Tol biopolymer transport system component
VIRAGLIALAIVAGAAKAADLPIRPTRHLAFDTREGTWMSLDVAPDGKTLVFDLLGHLYLVPSGGGPARAISAGMGFDTGATFSPDGRRIAFVSDRSGAENLWIADADGGHPRQITSSEDDTALVSPAWTPTGDGLYVSRYRADLQSYELWRFGLDGHGQLIVPVRDDPTTPRPAWRSTLGAVVSPDGKYLYAARHLGGTSLDEFDEWTIVRRDLASGAEVTVVAAPEGPRKALDPGAALRPQLSPDGRLMAYARRVEGQTELRLSDLLTGEDRRIAFPVNHDQVQALAWQDLEPRYAFTRDSRAIVLSQGRGIERIDLATGKAVSVPFLAHVDQPIGPSTRQDIREDRGPVRARLIMGPSVSPDGRTLAFSALGHLYLMTLDGSGAPRPFAAGLGPAFQPSWSPDGRSLTFVTWSETGAGAVWRAPADGAAAPVQISDLPAFYSDPIFSPDGQTVLALRSAQQSRLDLYMEYGLLRPASVVAFPAAGGPARVVTSGQIGGRVQFTRDGSAYILTDDGLDRVDLTTGQRTLAVKVLGPGWYFQDGPVPVDDLRISPDGKWLLAEVAQQLHLVAMSDRAGATVDLANPGLPHRRVTLAGADDFAWSADGRDIDYSLGSTLHVRPLDSVLLDPPDHPSWLAAPASAEERTFTAAVTTPRKLGMGALLLKNAKVLTMADGDRVLEHADILVRDGRFADIGPAGSLKAPPYAAVRDLSGLTVLPGFVDDHDHIATVRRRVLGLQDWGLRARLAYGVTTSFDPSTLTIDMLAYQDLLDDGQMLGPRLRQTGIALFSMQRFASLDEVMAVIRRYRDDYGLRNIKEYRTGNRRVREWVAMACAALGMQPTTEGALSFKLDLTQIIDGIAGNEHALVASPLREDVLRLLTAARTSYTTTLSITNGGYPGEDYLIARDDPRDDPKLSRFWPRVFRDQLFSRRPWRKLSEYRFPAIAADAARLAARGGLVGMGSHGEAPGIGFHDEMELHALGGMSPMAVLHAATAGSAETIGRQSEIGSIEPGKIADLVFLAADPLADIRNTRKVVQVMRDGVLYDAATLGEMWPQVRPGPAPVDDLAPGRWLPPAG